MALPGVSRVRPSAAGTLACAMASACLFDIKNQLYAAA